MTHRQLGVRREGDDVKIQASKEGGDLAHLLVNYVRRHQDEVEIVFDLIAAFNLPTGEPLLPVWPERVEALTPMKC